MKCNGRTPTYLVWEWKFSSGRCAVLYGDGNEPWNSYEPASGSKLASALAEDGGDLDWSLVPRIPFVRSTAAQTAALIRRLRRDQGCVVLTSRTWTPPKRWIGVTINGVRYRSLRGAANALGIGRFRLWRLYRLGRLGEL